MVIDLLKKYRVVLASKSPRRQWLLKELGIDFEVMVSNDLEESYPDGLSKVEITEYLARLKARHIMPEVGDSTLLITADTIVWMNDGVIGKPENEQDAFNILGTLSGSMHEVVTGVCLVSGKRERVFHASSLVWFAPLTGEEISYYIKKYKPYDKAGSYGIQEWIGYVGIEKIEGSYFNVMGLPVQRLYAELKDFLK